jgi:biopolymer transport protein ExbD
MNDAESTILLHADGRVQVDNEHANGPDELKDILLRLANRDPQPELRLHADNPRDYGRIGTIIYAVHRAGFADGKLTIAPAPN